MASQLEEIPLDQIRFHSLWVCSSFHPPNHMTRKTDSIVNATSIKAKQPMATAHLSWFGRCLGHMPRTLERWTPMQTETTSALGRFFGTSTPNRPCHDGTISWPLNNRTVSCFVAVKPDPHEVEANPIWASRKEFGTPQTLTSIQSRSSTRSAMTPRPPRPGASAWCPLMATTEQLSSHKGVRSILLLYKISVMASLSVSPSHASATVFDAEQTYRRLPLSSGCAP